VRGHKNGFPVILAASFFFFLNFSELMLLPKYIVHLGLSPVDIGLIMGAFTVTVLAALPFAGILAERLSRRAVFIFGASLLCLATPFYARVQGMGALVFALRIVQGVGFASAFGVLGAMVFDIAAPGSRRYFLGILTGVNISTHAIGPVLGEYVIHAHGYPLFFLTAGLLGSIGLAAGFFLPDGTSSERTRSFSLKEGLPFLAASAVLGTVFGSQVVFVPVFLLTRGMNSSAAFFVSFVAGSLMVWAFLHRRLRALGDARAWTLSLAALLVFPAGISFLTGAIWLPVLALVFGIGYGYLYPTLNALTLDVYPGSRSVANSLFVWSFNLGMLLASLGFGAVSDEWGYESAFVLSAIVGLAMLALVVRLRENPGAD
jgi:MFS family permease